MRETMTSIQYSILPYLHEWDKLLKGNAGTIDGCGWRWGTRTFHNGDDLAEFLDQMEYAEYDHPEYFISTDGDMTAMLKEYM